MLPAAAFLTALQESDFESSEYGIRLKIPAGWTVEATRQPLVILKLGLPGEFSFRPEILVYEVRMAEPVTMGQYKEQLRIYFGRAIKDPRLLDEESISVGGRPAFILTLVSKATGDSEAISYRGLVDMGPRRFVAVDGIFPKAKGEELRKTYTSLVASIRFTGRASAEIKEEFKKSKLPGPAAGANQKDELEIFMGEKKVGSWALAIRAGRRSEAAGLDVESSTSIDLGDDGQDETRLRGFLSDDLSIQTVEYSEVKTGKDKRVQYFTVQASLSGGQATIERRINGERSSASVKAPEKTVLSELAEALLYRTLETPPEALVLPLQSTFDDEPGILKIELAGKQQVKEGDSNQEVTVLFLLREGAALATFWYDKDRKITRVGYAGQPIVMKRKK